MGVQVDRLNSENPVFYEAKLGDKLKALIDVLNGVVAALQGGTFVLKAPVLSNSTTALSIGATPYQIQGVQAWRAAGTVALTATTHDVGVDKWAAFRVSVASGGTATITKGADQNTLALALTTIPAVPTNEADFGYFIVRGGTAAIFDATTNNLATGAVTGMIVQYYPASTPLAAIPTIS